MTLETKGEKYRHGAGSQAENWWRRKIKYLGIVSPSGRAALQHRKDGENENNGASRAA